MEQFTSFASFWSVLFFLEPSRHYDFHKGENIYSVSEIFDVHWMIVKIYLVILTLTCSYEHLKFLRCLVPSKYICTCISVTSFET